MGLPYVLHRLSIEGRWRFPDASFAAWNSGVSSLGSRFGGAFKDSSQDVWQRAFAGCLRCGVISGESVGAVSADLEEERLTRVKSAEGSTAEYGCTIPQ